MIIQSYLLMINIAIEYILVFAPFGSYCYLLKKSMTFDIVLGCNQQQLIHEKPRICSLKNSCSCLLQIVYTTVCLDDVPSEPSDFFPLSVNYQERFSAAGRTRYALHSLKIFLLYFPIPFYFLHEVIDLWCLILNFLFQWRVF